MMPGSPSTRKSRPECRGDVAPNVVAQRLGRSLPDFEACQFDLERRGLQVSLNLAITPLGNPWRPRFDATGALLGRATQVVPAIEPPARPRHHRPGAGPRGKIKAESDRRCCRTWQPAAGSRVYGLSRHPAFCPMVHAKLRIRGGFFSPSLGGGLPLLFRPSRRSSSATRAFKAAISAACVRISAIRPSCVASDRESPFMSPSIETRFGWPEKSTGRTSKGRRPHLGSYQIS
jgi:hypothetical protein